MIIERECMPPTFNDHMYDYQGCSSTIDHLLPPDFTEFHDMHSKIHGRDADVQLHRKASVEDQRECSSYTKLFLFYLNCTNK
jgi:hypothetical protein